MSATSAQADNEVAKKLVNFVIQQMRSGADKWTISQRLAATGIDRSESDKIVEAIYPAIVKTAQQQQVTTGSVVSGIFGGMLAAFIGGVAWGFIVKWTDYEIGFMAWGLGLLAGFMVVLFAKGKKGIPLQAAAVVSSVTGIAVGKYAIFMFMLRQAVLEKYGPESAAKVSALSDKVFAFFLKSLSSMLTGYDALWVILAVITAWRIPKGLGVRVPEQVIR